MKKLHLERQAVAPPKRLLGPETDVPVLVIVDLVQIIGQRFVLFLKRVRGRFAGQVAYLVEGESLSGGSILSRCGRLLCWLLLFLRQDVKRRQHARRDRSGQETATVERSHHSGRRGEPAGQERSRSQSF